MAMDQLDDDCMDDAQPRDDYDPGYDAHDNGPDARPSQGDDPGATPVGPTDPSTPQVTRRLDKQFPEEHCIHTPAPAGARTRSARGQAQRLSPGTTPLAQAP